MHNEYIVSVGPHIRSDISVQKIMFTVVAALTPAAVTSFYFFGINAIFVTLLTVGAAVAFEALIQQRRHIEITVADGSAIVAGLLLALNLPASSPWWIAVLGGFLAMAAKHVYGGLGYNPFNPAIVARVVLLISFPVHMTTWTAPAPLFSGIDAVTTATPLGTLQMGRIMKKSVHELAQFDIFSGITGSMGGSLGEVSAIAILLGVALLIAKKLITWHIPVSMIGTVMVLTGICWMVDPDHYVNPQVHLVTGGLLLGACFMATDMVTAPSTTKGQLIFGFGCGLITAVIRLWGGYPEGVSFSILLMNSVVPLIDKYTKPVTFGYVAAADE